MKGMGMQEFKTASGRVVKPGEDGSLLFGRANGYLSKESSFDAEEYFQAKRDEELGRWRSRVHPTYVVYSIGYDALVFGELVGLSEQISRGSVDGTENRVPAQVAFEYFEAHPEPRPWHTAQAGEFWLVEHTDVAETCRVDDVNGVLRFVGVDHRDMSVSMPITHESITGAVRLVAEVAA